jgi:hypothetical protein
MIPNKLYAEFFDNLSDMVGQTREGLRSLVTEHAEEMGMESLGEFDEWSPDTDVFPSSLNAEIDWGVVSAKVAKMGEPTGLFIVTSHRRLGVRGTKGDITFSMYDLQMRRLRSLQGLFEGTGV